MNTESISIELHKDFVIQILLGFPAAVFLFSAGTKFLGVKMVVEMFSLFKLSAFRHFAGIIESLSALLLLYPHTQILGALVSSCYLGACFLPSLQFSKPQFTVPPVGMMLVIWTAVMLKIHFV